IARARASARGIAIEIDPISGLKPVEGDGEIIARIGNRSPPRQSAPVLDLFLAPAPCSLLEVGVVMENPAQMMSVGAAVVFDEARRLDDPHDIRIELAAIEAIPRNFVERPVPHGAPPLCCCSSRESDATNVIIY